MNGADAIVRQMATIGEIQLIQTRYRVQLVYAWNITEGASILEIACGQGDMTAVLADAVGPNGHVTAIDIADPSYGAPISIGESAEHLLAGSLGPRIDFRFGVDLVDPAITFPDDAFDYVVIAHGSWYFLNLDQLARTLRRVSPWAKKLCFAEWDLTPSDFQQFPHLLSVLIQGQVELYKPASEANVRTPFSKFQLIELLANTGWSIDQDQTVDTSTLQDADWEVDYCLRNTPSDLESLDIPSKTKSFVASQMDVLRSIVALPNRRRPLPAYSIVATRTSSETNAAES